MGTITIVGTGWTAGQLTLDAAEALRGGAKVILHTDRCGCATWLSQQGIAYESLDALYEACEDFDAHARAAADAVIEAARSGDVAYCVADIRDRSARLLAGDTDLGARVIAGPAVEGALLALCTGETRVSEASEWEQTHFAARENCLIRELDSRELAAEVKLRLMEVYPEEGDIWLLQGREAPVSVPLYALDRAETYDHTTCALIPAHPAITDLERYDFQHLIDIQRQLCAPDGCPWDRVQTHESLRACMLEEAYEVIDAIDEGDVDHLCDELGDVLMQVAIHAEIARRHGEFDILDVTTAICSKLISRHSHIFGEDKAADPEAVLKLWSRNKMAERGQHSVTESMRDVTRTLPALLRAVKVLKRGADAGLGDAEAASIAARCAARFDHLPGKEDAEAWLGDVLMDVAGLARLLKIDPEIALNGAVSRFIDRFETVERESGGDFARADAQTLRKYWEMVKL